LLPLFQERGKRKRRTWERKKAGSLVYSAQLHKLKVNWARRQRGKGIEQSEYSIKFQVYLQFMNGFKLCS
jgi:hypothetical protein